ncbi:aspartate/glutamate racemase family protein [Brevibacillus massiliensis]|uniref:aspartate/glutamate racemase family protein n=1 Tax=Brevibacillus massiliensis TaxID=1118054 RepID=UPI00030EF31B|nr:aspartate/glutamate racemase family protein [Brevibacillus massiliensis]
MIGVIRVFTTEDQTILREHGKVIESLYGIPTVNKCIPDQPFGIHNDETERIAIPKIVALGKELEEQGCKVLVLSCAADPGIAELRRQVSIPVVGAGSTTALAAKGYGQPVGVMGITPDLPNVMKELLGDQLVAYGRPEGVSKTTDLLTEAGRKNSLAAARSLVEQGAKVLAFACTGYATIGLAGEIRQELGIPVIDPVEVEGWFASYALMSASAQSPKGGEGR